MIYDGIYDPKIIASIVNGINTDLQEGFVMRLAERLPYPDGQKPYGNFFRGIAKWVRRGHVQTDEHWMHAPVVPNEVKEQ